MPTEKARLLRFKGLAGWMILYACQQRLGAGLMMRRNTLLLFWFLVFSSLISASLGFASPGRHIAVLVRSESKSAVHIDVPGFLNPRQFAWLNPSRPKT
jgi:hypothetical protein